MIFYCRPCMIYILLGTSACKSSTLGAAWYVSSWCLLGAVVLYCTTVCLGMEMHLLPCHVLAQVVAV